MVLNPGGHPGLERRPCHRRTQGRIARTFGIMGGACRLRVFQGFDNFVHAERGDATAGEAGCPPQPTVHRRAPLNGGGVWDRHKLNLSGCWFEGRSMAAQIGAVIIQRRATTLQIVPAGGGGKAAVGILLVEIHVIRHITTAFCGGAIRISGTQGVGAEALAVELVAAIIRISADDTDQRGGDVGATHDQRGGRGWNPAPPAAGKDPTAVAQQNLRGFHIGIGQIKVERSGD